jgi:putative ABC transport system substrate-binding protein
MTAPGQIRRRRFLLGVAVLLTPWCALAQRNSRVWRIGIISAGDGSYFDEFPKAMRGLGYELGKDYVVESRSANGRYESLPALAADLVKGKMDVIVGMGTPAIAAATRATSSIPIVMAVVGDPVATGFVKSLARPGGNITGLSLATTDTSSKWLELARTIAPRSPVGVLADPNQATGKWHLGNIQAAAQRLGIRIAVAHAPAVDDVEDALASLAKEHVATVIMLPSSMFFIHAARVSRAALKHRIALIATTRDNVLRGALLSYGQDYAAFVRRAAVYVDKILKGARPGELPVEQPLIFQLVINKATARQLALPIQSELLLRADEVIE